MNFRSPAVTLPGRAVGETRVLHRARGLLTRQFDRNVPLEELSSAASMSKFHFCRMFRERYGLTPHAFQIHVRVERACVALLHVAPGQLARDGLANGLQEGWLS